MEIKIRGIEKTFGNFPALRGVNLDVHSGELIALLGPSGSGKTTLLRAIAGLEFADRGQIFFGGEDAAQLPVQQRKVGFVFQHYALFKHMRVLDNVAFGLQMRKGKDRPSAEAIRRRSLELLDLVQLSGLDQRFPAQLSGGQRQRVALARALAIEPRVLLLDEPFGALDAKVRKDLRRWLRELHDQTGVTTIFVTHDQEEALELADRVVVMNQGQIEQVGGTDEVYEQPKTPFVFDFLGSVNRFPARLHNQIVRLDGSEVALEYTADHPAGAVDVYVRPHDLRLGDRGLPAQVTHTQRTGATIRVSTQALGVPQPVEIELSHLDPQARQLAVGDAIHLQVESFGVFPRQQRAPTHAMHDVAPNAPAEQRERGR